MDLTWEDKEKVLKGLHHAFEEWLKEGRTSEQGWAVGNFLSSKHIAKLFDDTKEIKKN